ncbi:MAG TPA: DPP IV N-terminal domain-containing protein [Acidimicrobiales bacterium]|nr:DPP IV N-terminal domain-containing protein [Acidimicrobiales bacterium]
MADGGPAGGAEAAPRPITVDDVAHQPLPGASVPAALAFSPDGRYVTYLHSPDRGLTRELFAHDVETGEVRRVLEPVAGGDTEANLTLDEKLRRERRRELGLGVTRYAWAETAGVLLIPTSDGVLVKDGVEGDLRRVVDHPVVDPMLSPDGRLVAYVDEGEVHVVAADGSGPHRQLTSGARSTGRTNGLAEFIAQEEIDRLRGFWWSPDSARIAFCEVDERHIPVYRIVHQGSDAVGEAAQEDHRYPFAGGDNARVRLGIVEVDEGEPVWADLGEYEYLARVDWHPDGYLLVQVEDRRQQELRVLRVDPVTGVSTPLLTETSDIWINVHDLLRPVRAGGFLWGSERTGYRHLEVRDDAGALIRTLTAGKWFVESVAALDDRHVWFTATKDSPLERHLYVVPLEGGPDDVQRVTREPGTHAVVVDAERGRFVDTRSSLEHPPVVLLRHLHGGVVIRSIFDEPDPRVAELGLAALAPELTTIDVDDVTIHVALWVPEGEGPFPTVVSVYGGPHAQRVTDSWLVTVRLREQLLRQMGYLVVTADNRGSWGRGLEFEGAVRHELGDLEVRDQAAVVGALVARGLADPARVGIFGWSYGGYMSAMALVRAPDVFAVAVAGAPVTHWDGYDTHYTERYMGLPAENVEGYERSSVLAHVEALRGHLLLVHGLIDENVHFRHTARLVNALIRARKRYELLLFPDERHLPRREEDRVYMEERILTYVCTHL